MSDCCRLDEEALEFLKHGYSRCFYVSLYCPHCGVMRMMAPLPPEAEFCDCPACLMPHRNCGVLGIGYNRRKLPLIEILDEPINLIVLTGLTEPAARPAAKARKVDDEHFISVTGRVSRIGPKFGCAGYRAHAARG